jgi:hypothetical protein
LVAVGVTLVEAVVAVGHPTQSLYLLKTRMMLLELLRLLLNSMV